MRSVRDKSSSLYSTFSLEEVGETGRISKSAFGGDWEPLGLGIGVSG